MVPLGQVDLEGDQGHHKLTKSDAGKTITVKVTAKLAGHQTVALTAAPTAKVIK